MRVSRLRIYPIKSVSGVVVEEARVRDEGLEGDRMFMITDHKGAFITQREIPALATLKAFFEEGKLRLSAPGKTPVELPVKAAGERLEVEVWGDRFYARDIGETVSAWISDFAGRQIRVVTMDPRGGRTLGAEHGGGPVSFADGYPLLIASDASLERLNQHLDDPVPMERFRPNVAIEGSSAFEEDRWKRIRIGSSEFKVVKPCARCVVTTIDQKSGVKTGPEPLNTLRAFRRADVVYPDEFERMGLPAGSVLFGQNLVPVSGGGTISVGDELEVIE